MTYFKQVFKQPQVNNTDSIGTSRNKTDSGVSQATVSEKKISVEKPILKEQSVAISVTTDSLLLSNLQDNHLFTVPYRCKLNRDSLKVEMRKVVLEIDTMPKGLTLIINKNLIDTSEVKTLSYSKSLFTHHLLVPKRIEPLPKQATQNNWMVLLLVLVLFLLAILRVFYQKKFTLFVNAFISKRFSNQILREENALTQTTSIVLSVVFFISIALFFYLVNHYYHKNIGGYNDWQNFVVILISCVGFYFVKLLANKLGGYIFKVYKETDEYVFNQFLVLQILGILLTIWCILLNYSTNMNKEFLIYAGFGTLFLGFLVRMIKSFSIANMNTYSPVYIFLYLCTLEILPLIIIVKLIIR